MIRCDKLARGAGGLVHQERSVARGATFFSLLYSHFFEMAKCSIATQMRRICGSYDVVLAWRTTRRGNVRYDVYSFL